MMDLANMARPEALNPELLPYVRLNSFPVLQHPLIYSVPYSPQMNAWLNEAYAHKKEITEAALSQKNFNQYVFLHERPYRLNAFNDIAPHLSPVDYWALIRKVYQDSENVEEVSDLWREALDVSHPCREAMMLPAEREVLAQLPSEFTIWRGAADLDELEQGYSWSLEEQVAHWFASRFNTKGLVAQGRVFKKDVLAYLETRNEFEIIVFPEKVTLGVIQDAVPFSKKPGIW